MLNENYKVVIVEGDFYARNAINSYLAWDRRTRVTQKLGSLNTLIAYLNETIQAELPDTILVDDTLLLNPDFAAATVARIHSLCPADVIVMVHTPVSAMGHAIRQAGGKGYVDREDVGLQVSWMIGWAKNYSFITSPKTAALFQDSDVLPNGREYPELTDRVRQALMLCVVEGMSADLAADEMGLSPHTIRTYIKEGYSILEAHDQNEYPAELSAQEKAFMRFTMLAYDAVKNAKQNSKGS